MVPFSSLITNRSHFIIAILIQLSLLQNYQSQNNNDKHSEILPRSKPISRSLYESSKQQLNSTDVTNITNKESKVDVDRACLKYGTNAALTIYIQSI